MPGAADDWADWLDRHGPALVLFARAWVPTRADAEDVVQEAFVRFWRSRDRAADPTGYLFACVKRAALDWARSNSRRAAVASALDALPEAQREVLVMKVWGGLTFPQIAAAL